MAAPYSPTGCPLRKWPRLPPRKKSFLPTTEAWSDEENKALVEFVLFHCEPTEWLSHSKTSKFWKDAAEFVWQRSKATMKRSGK